MAPHCRAVLRGDQRQVAQGEPDGAMIPAIVVTSPGALRDFLRHQAEQILEHARQCKFPAERVELEQLARGCLLKVEAIEREQ